MAYYWGLDNGQQTRETKRWEIQFLVVYFFNSNMDCPLVLGWIISLKIVET